MFKPKISEEERLKREAERRAAFGKARLARMKDSANWNRGFHTQDIEAQKQERIDRKKAQKDEEIAYSKHMLTLVEQSLEEEKVRSAEKRKRLQESAQALLAVDKKASDTFDLNNPDVLRMDAPPRVADDAPTPVSSLQKFDGEDLGFGQRKRAHQAEMKTRLQSQMEEHEMAKMKEKMSDVEYAAFIKKQTEHLEKLELEKSQRRQNQTIKTAQENARILKEQHQMMEELKRQEALLAERDVESQKASSLLTEKLEDTLRADNSSRYIPYGFKGFGIDKTKEYFNQRQEQAQEHENLKTKLKEEEQNWVSKEEAQRREMLKIEMERRREKLAKRQQYAAELKEQAMQHKNKLMKTDKELANEVTEDFFAQFGTSHR